MDDLYNYDGQKLKTYERSDYLEVDGIAIRKAVNGYEATVRLDIAGHQEFVFDTVDEVLAFVETNLD